MFRATFFALGLSLIGSTSLSWAAISLPPAAPVVDEVGLLSSSQRQQLSGILTQAKERSRVETTVFIAKDMRELDLNGFSMAVAEEWKLGEKGEDRGLLFVIVPSERKMRLEVGYGLEGDVPDALARRFLDENARPRFRAGDYFGGILSTLGAVQERVNLGLGPEELGSLASRTKKITIPPWAILLIFFVAFALQAVGAQMGVRAPRRFGGRGWSGGYGGGGWGAGGGSWGGGGSSWGGGGGFGGGGSSSSW